MELGVRKKNGQRNTRKAAARAYVHDLLTRLEGVDFGDP